MLSACGGGGGSSAPPTNNPPPSGGTATALITSPAAAKAQWRIATPITVTLKDAAGTTLPAGGLSCATTDASKLTVTADCTSVTGARIGVQTITVTSGTLSATASLTVTPQWAALGTNGVSSSYGSGSYNLVTMADSTVSAWGANLFGVMGQGAAFTTANASAPLPLTIKNNVAAANLAGLVQSSAGNTAALALAEDGQVWSWGYNAQNQLGRTTLSNASDSSPGNVTNIASSGNVQSIAAIAAGDGNMIALVDDGTALNWGQYPGDGGSLITVTHPVQVKGPTGATALRNIVQVSAGSNWSAALRADGKVLTWGFQNSAGWLGNGSTALYTNLPATVKRQSDGADLSGVVAISAGYNFGLALLSDGSVYAWGYNSFGQLGQNTIAASGSLAVQVKGDAIGAPLTGITMVAAGGNHALALDSSGNVWSWGYSQNGQLGDGVNHPRVNQSALPAAVVAQSGTAQLTGVISIAAGYSQSLALKSDGTVLIWGSGFRGNLGQGPASTADLYVPTPVKDATGTSALKLTALTNYQNLKRRGL
jgi:alpha-tubulin suppressor-like RCC1 family protein